MNQHGSTDVVVGFVRGERPWTDLGRLAVEIRFDNGAVRVTGDLPSVVVPSASDFAMGFVADRGERERREWAAVVLGLGDIDLSAIEDGPLVEGLWAIAGGEPLPSTVVDEIRRLTTL